MGDELAWYATPGRLTTLAEGLPLPSDAAGAVAIVQGLLVYDLVARPWYGVELSEVQAAAIHERDSARLVEIVRALDPRPIDEPRAPAQRVGARCHAFSRMTVALLRAAGIPARARCGFASYFVPDQLEDHWVAEWWDGGRWRMADAQLDATWRSMIGFTGDPLAITGTAFITAGHAWRAWRRGELDARRCGLTSIGEHGAHWIAGNLRLDLASLNKVEMLPWDVWGAGWEPGDEATDDLLACFDAVAELTVDPDAHAGELRRRYETDDRLRIPGSVFNVLRGEVETV